jgi:hypothetical protein
MGTPVEALAGSLCEAIECEHMAGKAETWQQKV